MFSILLCKMYFELTLSARLSPTLFSLSLENYLPIYVDKKLQPTWPCSGMETPIGTPPCLATNLYISSRFLNTSFPE